VRQIISVHTPNDPKYDIAIAKVHLPFFYTRTVQEVALAPSQFVIPGNKKLFQFSITRKK